MGAKVSGYTKSPIRSDRTQFQVAIYGGCMQSQENLHFKLGSYWLPPTSFRGILAGIACLLLFTAVGFGQGVSGRLQGTIQDGTGAVVPSAKVSVTGQDTGITNQYVSDNRGEYIANLLPPGTYKVEVSAPGFRTTVSSGNVVTVDGVTRVDVALALGVTAETVQVAADNPLVNTTSSSLGEVLNTRDIDSLPLNGRVFSQLVQTVPGAVATGFGSAPEAGAHAGAGLTAGDQSLDQQRGGDGRHLRRSAGKRLRQIGDKRAARIGVRVLSQRQLECYSVAGADQSSLPFQRVRGGMGRSNHSQQSIFLPGLPGTVAQQRHFLQSDGAHGSDETGELSYQPIPNVV